MCSKAAEDEDNKMADRWQKDAEQPKESSFS
jgi:hypothetical protein